MSAPVCTDFPEDSGYDDLFVLCPACCAVSTECPRCDGTGSIRESLLTDEERFAGGFLPIDWDAAPGSELEKDEWLDPDIDDLI